MYQRFFIFILFALSFILPLRAALKVEVTSGTHAPIPIAAPFFEGPEGTQISQVICANLVRSNLFRVIQPGAYLQSSAEVLAGPRFPEWQVIQAQALLAGRVTLQGDDLRVECYLFDVLSQKSLLQLAFVSVRNNWRRVAHKIADAVYQRLTGEKPYFDTQIVYVAEQGMGKNKVQRLAMMDQDGANHRYLGSKNTLVLSPSFSPKKHEITYMSFDTQPPGVRVMDLETGQSKLLRRFSGMSYAPRFSQDGRMLVMSLTTQTGSGLYTMDLISGAIRRLTKTVGTIDTSASYSPNGQNIVFNSDRGGTPQLYVMPATAGSEAVRISFGPGRYFAPLWSPRGDLIAFIKSHDGAFRLGVMKPDGTGERIIYQSYLLESPCWAPNGRVLLFACQTGPTKPFKIYSIDLTGHNIREIMTPAGATHPAWSSILP